MSKISVISLYIGLEIWRCIKLETKEYKYVWDLPILNNILKEQTERWERNYADINSSPHYIRLGAHSAHTAHSLCLDHESYIHLKWIDMRRFNSSIFYQIWSPATSDG